MSVEKGSANTARLILHVYDFFVYNLNSYLPYIIHPPNPSELIFCSKPLLLKG